MTCKQVVSSKFSAFSLFSMFQVDSPWATLFLPYGVLFTSQVKNSQPQLEASFYVIQRSGDAEGKQTFRRAACQVSKRLIRVFVLNLEFLLTEQFFVRSAPGFMTNSKISTNLDYSPIKFVIDLFGFSFSFVSLRLFAWTPFDRLQLCCSGYSVNLQQILSVCLFRLFVPLVPV